jgi:hypothetical protein
MAKTRFDGVIEAVRYQPNGQVKWVRAYVRRGPIFSDRLVIDRQALIDQIKAGKLFLAGRRIELMASTFETSAPVKLIQKDHQDILVTGDIQSNRDLLEGIPPV